MLIVKKQLIQQKEKQFEEDLNAKVILDLVSEEEHHVHTDVHQEDLVEEEMINQQDDTLDVHLEMELDHHVLDLEVVLVEETVEVLEKVDLKLGNLDQKDNQLVVDKK